MRVVLLSTATTITAIFLVLFTHSIACIRTFHFVDSESRFWGLTLCFTMYNNVISFVGLPFHKYYSVSSNASWPFLVVRIVCVSFIFDIHDTI